MTIESQDFRAPEQNPLDGHPGETVPGYSLVGEF